MIVDQKIRVSFVGAYLIDGVLEGAKLGVIKKPNLFRRVCAYLFLGWKWVSINEIKNEISK